MGVAASSTDLQTADINELERDSGFRPGEVKKLYDRFRKLDRTGRGFIRREDLLKIPELAMNPLVHRIIALFRPTDSVGKDGVWQINFKEFLKALSVFSEKGSIEAKASFAFRIYDVDGDGFVGHSDMVEVMKAMVGENVTDEKLLEIVSNTIEAWDVDNDGKLNFEEFFNGLSKETNEKHMTMTFKGPERIY